MNAQSHRLVFNPTRGCLIAVAESARSGGKSGVGGTRGMRRCQHSIPACNKVHTSNHPPTPIPPAQEAINSGVIQFCNKTGWSSSTASKQASSGLTLGASSGLLDAMQGVLSTADSLGNAVQATKGDSRMQALGAASAALGIYNAVNSIANLATTATSAGISLSYGSSSSTSTTNDRSNTAAASSVSASGSVSITASGADASKGEASNLLVQGSDIHAGTTATLAADHQVRIQAAANSTEQHSANTSKSGSIGVTFSAGSQNGFSFQAGASRAKGQGDGAETTYSNSHVGAGGAGGAGKDGAVTIRSGGDTTLSGAVVAAHTVQADVGGQLVVQSLQDSATFTSKQDSADPTVPSSVKAWQDISAELAKNASGDVRAVLGSQMRPQSIWETFEFPALTRNPAVTRIIAVDPKTGVERVIYQRPTK